MTPLRGVRGQQGAALIVGLVLLMVLTLLAVSTMRTASLELMMAGNAQLRANAFQLAESGVEAVLGEIAAGNIRLQRSPDWQQAIPDRNIDMGPLRGRYENAGLRLVGASLAPGSSGDLVTRLHYRVSADGVTLQGANPDPRSGRARLVQGIVREGPPVPGEEN